jgi:tRNA threonylcarbamoyl adenosine modification protein YeaZ
MSRPLFLAIDNSGHCLSVAIGNAHEGPFASRTKKGEHRSESIAALTSEVCNEVGCHISECEGILFGAGPGSFTGLRIGYAFVQGLSLASGVAALPIGSLLAAGSAAEFLGRQPVCVLRRARRDEFFVHSILPLLSSELRSCSTVEVSALLEKARGQEGKAPLALGEVEEFPAEWQKKVWLPEELSIASGLLRLSAKSLDTGRWLRGAHDLSQYEPLYVTPVAAKTIEERTRLV